MEPSVPASDGKVENRQRLSHQWLAPDFDEPVRFAIMSFRLPVFMASAM